MEAGPKLDWLAEKSGHYVCFTYLPIGFDAQQAAGQIEADENRWDN